MEWKVQDEIELKNIIPEILKFIPQQGVVLFEGKMGAGKTTLIRNLFSELSIDTFQGSPTYSIVHEYLSKEFTPIYHFDLYRIENQEELISIGFDDYIYNNSLSFIEWPEKSLKFLPEKRIWVYIRVSEEGKRIIEVKNDN
jgi:tRNA threonylcarbamoyladenosine biosynthesis protein TsaE